MPGTSATEKLRGPVAAWICGAITSADLVSIAVELLAEVNDDTAVLAIAILPPHPDAATLREVIDQVFEAAEDMASLHEPQAHELALRWQVHRYIGGHLSPHAVCTWLASEWRRDPEHLGEFLLLDDDYAEGVISLDDFTKRVDIAVRELLAAGT